MICDKDKFVKLDDYDGGVVRFSNNNPFLIKGKRSINPNGKTNIDDVLCM